MNQSHSLDEAESPATPETAYIMHLSTKDIALGNKKFKRNGKENISLGTTALQHVGTIPIKISSKADITKPETTTSIDKMNKTIKELKESRKSLKKITAKHNELKEKIKKENKKS